ncbi:MAG: hypothetical protein WBD20_21410 [Pirellulaceae bacterium]
MASLESRTTVFSHRFSRFSTSLAAAVVTTCLFSIGCGKSEVAQAPDPANSAAVKTASAPIVPPTDVVSQFLDQVRRGGANSEAGQFLTQKAQVELKRIGRSVKPMGSPDAHFDVIQAVSVPNEENAMLVESLWTEPNKDGTKSQFQVVWSVEKEPAGWRISGLALLEEGSEAPYVVDFENGNSLAQMLDEGPAPEADKAAQAAAPSEGLNR